jgi:uncharacterized membrane protein YoaK (UPF0700 family)/anti-anti-sigma regulatory factor
MLVAQAHSFSQKARLAVTLAWVAGYVNVVGLVVCGRAVSHVSGTVSTLGKDVTDGDWALLGSSAWLLWWFLVGAFGSGMAMHFARARRWKSIYVLPIAIEAAALVALGVVVALSDAPQVEGARTIAGPALLAATGIACFAMGLQNATITRISGGVVRTTHVTGVLTDLGLELFALIPRRGASRPTGSQPVGGLSVGERAGLLASILASFGIGAGLGGWALTKTVDFVLVPPFLFLAWIIWVDSSQPIADLQHAPPADDADPGLWPPNMAVFRLRCRSSRRGTPHRLPNMQTWLEELDPSVDVAVLDLCDASDLESAGAEELCIIADRMHRSGKALVIAGVDDSRHPTLRAAGLNRVMPVDCVTPDLESALKPASERAWRLAVRAAAKPSAGGA